MVDLHTHSTASDGALSPRELVALARSEGLSALALTDHDTVAGVDQAMEEAGRLGLRLLAGVELEVDWKPGIFHLLGIGLKRWHGAARRRLEQAQRQRTDRNLSMIRSMRAGGIPITYEELQELAGHEVVGRPHFARWLLARGIVSSYDEAFDTMLGEGRRFFERKRAPGVGASCAIIHAAGGKAILAHPDTLRMGADELARSLRRWKSEGLDGVEAYTPRLPCEEGYRIAAAAEELGLLVTAGSDFHGPDRSRLGRSCDGRTIDDEILAKLVD